MTRRRHPDPGDDDGDSTPVPPTLVVGVAAAISPLVRRILAPNPGIMTGPGTNTYLVGVDEIVVIDPGPDEASHLDAIAACGGDRIRWIVCTHTHPDHSPGAAGLKARTGAEVLAFADRDGLECDRHLAGGDSIEATEFRLTAVHTPGHASNHLCFLLEEERLLFSGDHVMQGSTVVINPPDGDMAQYLDSLEQLLGLRHAMKAIAPAHGHVIDQPHDLVRAYLEHRRDREAQVLAELGPEPVLVPSIVERIYTEVAPELHPVAARSVWAHLRKLHADGLASCEDPDDVDAGWRLRRGT
ncbi:MAG TPA: MBL fold metallo-hydrolase [Acidimicrobiales bacterium]|jgi:glyoxylase-like metal-dependent hydrolase (beta-lactamase superfamily II)|nr:MBL fold metallo-hydrolase [Acidimicrobiales bacterium]